ncbi:hypothetical protein [Nocardia sp. NPDC056100]|uniref:hypothetical protein n=1 Tax=Nocardia sp. NPDC056100 TaxID=3345712 RepID=UPI0035DF84DA
MSGGDPLDEGGQALRTGFVQAMQTAAMTMNLLQRRGAESRSKTEFAHRMDEAEVRTRNNAEVHELKVAGYQSRQRHETELHQLERHFKLRQIDRVEELHDLERQIKRRVLERGDADLDRRVADSSAERANKDEIHRLQRRNLLNRGDWEKERHDLDVEYKQLLIDIRRRAAGFSETLAGHHRDDAAAMRAAAAYAAAASTADLSDEHRSHADAFAERLNQDADLTAPDLMDTGTDAPAANPAASEAIWRAVRGLADELTFHIVARHRAAQAPKELEAKAAGTAIEAAIDMSEVIDVEFIDGFGEEPEPGDGPDPGGAPTPGPSSPPDAGVDP